MTYSKWLTDSRQQQGPSLVPATIMCYGRDNCPQFHSSHGQPPAITALDIRLSETPRSLATQTPVAFLEAKFHFLLFQQTSFKTKPSMNLCWLNVHKRSSSKCNIEEHVKHEGVWTSKNSRHLLFKLLMLQWNCLAKNVQGDLMQEAQ